MRITLKAPLYLIRHGETDWNAEERFQGQTDIPLNPKGLGQAAGNGDMLRERLSHEGSRPEDWYYLASPLGRTRQTMELVRTQLGLSPTGYDTDKRLLEVSFGDWEHHTLAELERTTPQEIAKRAADKWLYQPPSGESYADLRDRIAPVFEAIDRPTIMVAHGGVIRAARTFLEGMDGAEAAQSETPQDTFYYADSQKAGWIDTLSLN